MGASWLVNLDSDWASSAIPSKIFLQNAATPEELLGGSTELLLSFKGGGSATRGWCSGQSWLIIVREKIGGSLLHQRLGFLSQK
jgi:hypothetical protein